MIIIYDKDLKPLGELDKVIQAPVKRRANELWEASFQLPKNDPKNKLCDHFHFVDIYGGSGFYYGKYRIMDITTTKNNDEDVIEYSCEHVLSTLLDDIMFKYHQFTNYTTREVLESILDMQAIKHWELDVCEFERYFHYSFENEAGLLAPILSIPQPFDESYLFTFDTTVYPWKLSLVKASNDVIGEIRWGKDMIDFREVADPKSVVNKIFPLGSGEGVNQLGIEDVNNGIPYIKDEASIAMWGEKSYPWIDKRFDNAQSLKDNAQSLLDQWKNPKISFSCSGVDLSIKKEYAHEKREVYGIINIIVDDIEYQARIIEDSRSDVLGSEYDVRYSINNKLDDIATTQADIERKIQVNDAYSQGSTNIMVVPAQDNANSSHPLTIPFVIDDDVVNVNTCELWFETKPFRTYSQAVNGGGSIVKSTGGGGGTTATSSSGGGTTATSSSGGGVSKSTNSGGATTRTSSNDGTHSHIMFSGEAETQPASSNQRLYEMRDLNGNYAYGYLPTGNPIIMRTWEESGAHSHSISIPSHSHSFNTPNHTHSVNIPNHQHTITLPNHTHTIELPNHTHDILHGIYEYNNTPSNVTIKVDGNTVDFNGTSGDRINLIDYIEKDSSGKITRGRHEITLSPNVLARIEAELVFRVFVRSHIGGTY